MEFGAGEPDAELLVDDAEKLDSVHAIEREIAEPDIVAPFGREVRQAKPQPLGDEFGGAFGCGHRFGVCCVACAAQRSRPKATHAECAARPSPVKIAKRSPKNAPCRL